MKKILTILMMSICMASFGQKEKIFIVSEREYDSLVYLSITYKDRLDLLINITDRLESENDAANTKANALKSLNDSLVAKINKMLIFHYYACQIIQTINSDGSIRSRKDLIEAVRQYHTYYKNKP